MPFAIIIRGPSGVGKSSISKQLKQHIPKLIHLDIDSFKHIISKESSDLRSEIAHKVGSFFLTQLIHNKFNVIIEEILREKYYREVTKLLKKSKYKVITIFLAASKDELIKRDKNRVKNKGVKIISALYQEITPLQEDLIINTTNKTIKQVKSLIIQELITRKII